MKSLSKLSLVVFNLIEALRAYCYYNPILFLPITILKLLIIFYFEWLKSKLEKLIHTHVV